MQQIKNPSKLSSLKPATSTCRRRRAESTSLSWMKPRTWIVFSSWIWIKSPLLMTWCDQLDELHPEWEEKKISTYYHCGHALQHRVIFVWVSKPFGVCQIRLSNLISGYYRMGMFIIPSQRSPQRVLNVNKLHFSWRKTSFYITELVTQRGV